MPMLKALSLRPNGKAVSGASQSCRFLATRWMGIVAGTVLSHGHYGWSRQSEHPYTGRWGKIVSQKVCCMKLCRSIFLTLAVVSLVGGEALAGSIRINGSTTILPVVQAVAEAFMQDHPDVNVSVSAGGSGNGIKALIDGSVDIADSSRFLKEEEVKAAIERGVYPVPFAVAYDCIVPVVHPSNSMENITLVQLKDVYSGRIKNWKQLGGPDIRIVVISRDTSSGTYEVWDEKVMNKGRVFPGALLQASNGAIIQTVSRNKHALGYAGIGYLDNTVKALSVDGVRGTSESVLGGQFPIARALFMFTRGWPTGDTLNFINYTINPALGQRHVKAAAFIPLY